MLGRARRVPARAKVPATVGRAAVPVDGVDKCSVKLRNGRALCVQVHVCIVGRRAADVRSQECQARGLCFCEGRRVAGFYIWRHYVVMPLAIVVETFRHCV